LERLESLERIYVNGQSGMRNKLQVELPDEIKRLEKTIAEIDNDLAVRDGNMRNQPDFSITLGTETISDKTEANKKILEMSRDIQDFHGQPIGKFREFDLSASFDPLNRKHILSLSHDHTYFVDVGSDSVQRLINRLNSIEVTRETFAGHLETARANIVSLQAELNKPFAKSDELKELQARLATINASLDMEHHDDPAANVMLDVIDDGYEEGNDYSLAGYGQNLAKNKVLFNHFCKLNTIDLTHPDNPGYWKFVVEGSTAMMPLHLQYLGKDEKSGFDRFSLHHTFEQNGDLMMDPEMEFTLTDDALTFVSFRQDGVLARYEYAYDEGSGSQLSDNAAFGRQWLNNILTMDYELEQAVTERQQQPQQPEKESDEWQKTL
jgi:uncharacterized protein related to proFAR isomerase